MLQKRTGRARLRLCLVVHALSLSSGPAPARSRESRRAPLIIRVQLGLPAFLAVLAVCRARAASSSLIRLLQSSATRIRFFKNPIPAVSFLIENVIQAYGKHFKPSKKTSNKKKVFCFLLPGPPTRPQFSYMEATSAASWVSDERLFAHKNTDT